MKWANLEKTRELLVGSLELDESRSVVRHTMCASVLARIHHVLMFYFLPKTTDPDTEEKRPVKGMEFVNGFQGWDSM